MKLAVFLAFAIPLAAQETLLRIPATRTSVEIGQLSIAIATSGSVRTGAQPDHYTLSLSADRSDLQAHATEILRSDLDRSEACGDRIGVLRATLVPTEAIAILTTELHFERWACAKALGKTIDKRIVAGDAVVRVALQPALESSARVHLDAEVREIKADGALGELLRSGTFGAALQEKIRSRVQSALDKAAGGGVLCSAAGRGGSGPDRQVPGDRRPVPG